MSLVGNLEDLGLGEILQIVNLSRKSGVLELVSGARSGRIYLQVGQIVRATATTFPENLGDLLLRAGLVDLDIIKRALCIQQEEGAGRRIGDILVERFGIDRSAVDAVVSQQIERIVCSFTSIRCSSSSTTASMRNGWPWRGRGWLTNWSSTMRPGMKLQQCWSRLTACWPRPLDPPPS